MDSYTFFVAWFFGSIISGCVTVLIAKARGHRPSFWWFLFGFFLFVIAVIAAVGLPPKAARNNPQRKCPYCGADVPSANRVCSACDRSLPDLGTATVNSWEKTVAAGDDVEKWAKQNQPK